jgi:hypothetical protein
MSEFPKFVYSCPGPFVGPPGVTFKTETAHDEKAFAQAIAEGWFETLPQAADAFLNPSPAPRIVAAVEVSENEADDEAPPTREEMMIKAEELGIVVDRRWSDKTLSQKILDAIDAQEEPT